MTSTIKSPFKRATITGLTTPAGTFSAVFPSDCNCVLAVIESSCVGIAYCVQYGAITLGFFLYVEPHAPLANEQVTITILYV